MHAAVDHVEHGQRWQARCKCRSACGMSIELKFVRFTKFIWAESMVHPVEREMAIKSTSKLRQKVGNPYTGRYQLPAFAKMLLILSDFFGSISCCNAIVIVFLVNAFELTHLSLGFGSGDTDWRHNVLGFCLAVLMRLLPRFRRTHKAAPTRLITVKTPTNRTR